MMILFSAFLFGLCNFHVLKQLSCTIESQIVILGSVMSALLWSIKLALEPWSSALNELAGYVEHCLWSGWRRIEGSPRPNNPITVPVHNTKPDYCPCTEEKKDFLICLDKKDYQKKLHLNRRKFDWLYILIKFFWKLLVCKLSSFVCTAKIFILTIKCCK